MSEIQNRFTGAVICSGLCSVKELAEANKANLCGADLSWANLRGADLSGANLYGAILSGANLLFSDMSEAKYGEETLLKYLNINPIGSRNDALQVFITRDNTYLRTGCWYGSPEELLARTDRNDYKEAVDYIVIVAKRVREEATL